MAGGSNHIDRTYDQPVASADEDRQGSGDLFLIDGNSLAYRAFFALPESIATSDGRPTNAIYGFASMMVKVLTDFRPRAVAAAWDAGMSGREKIYEPYKAQRSSRPDLLKEQWPHLAPLSDAFGFANVRVDGWEADDVIATMVRQAREREIPVMVVTGDRDAYQLVGDGVRVMSTSRGVTDTKIYDQTPDISTHPKPPMPTFPHSHPHTQNPPKIPPPPQTPQLDTAQLNPVSGHTPYDLWHIPGVHKPGGFRTLNVVQWG